MPDQQRRGRSEGLEPVLRRARDQHLPRWQLSPKSLSAMGPLAIPITPHGSLLARLDRLAPTREVAQIGPALGRSFSHVLISAFATMPKQQLGDALAQLIDAELIFRRGTPPDAEHTFNFKHALVQDAAYSTLQRCRRQQLHGRIAAALETHFSEFNQPEVPARHCAEARQAEKAVGYWLKAG